MFLNLLLQGLHLIKITGEQFVSEEKFTENSAFSTEKPSNLKPHKRRTSLSYLKETLL